jgi:hypothetical protein
LLIITPAKEEDDDDVAVADNKVAVVVGSCWIMGWWCMA